MKLHKGIYLPDNDTHFAEHMDKGPMYRNCGTYQFKKILMAMKEVPVLRRRVAIDIGAHVGFWSRYLADHFTKVLAFEPVPEHIECFKKNLVKEKREGSHLSYVVLHPVALGNVNSSMLITTTPDNSGNAHVTPDNASIQDLRGGKAVTKVLVKRLDEIPRNEEIVDFIKIDVEGYELEVVRGGEKLIKTTKPILVIEQKPGNGSRYGYGDIAAVELVKKWGAQVLWEKSGDYCLGWK